MKNSHFLLALLAATCLVLASCKKNEEESPTPSTTIQDFFEKYEVKEQAFIVNIDHDKATITGEQGTTVTFPKSAFHTKDGLPATGEISIQLTEIYDKSDMVLSDRPTTSDGTLLLSGGEIFISALINGDTLQLADRTAILIELPASSVDKEMQLFTGAIDNNNPFNWTPLKTNLNQTAPTGTSWSRDSVSTFYEDASKYIFSVTKLGWINCDRFYSIPNKTKIDVSFTNRGEMDQTTAYLVFKNINSVARFYERSSDGVLRSGEIPIGETVTIVAFSLKNGKEHFGLKEITTSENLNVVIDLTEGSEDEIRTALEVLN
ncbi:MAG: hypothetical protein K0R51_1394 [Cytophagaceae bacterium]|jgi:hypothetical protein|nr:hypothetical protein [Cytophagaceae bacterium]